ncbi:MAG: zinc ribbon domain-containing protein [Legionellaceae bacterium]|nr:zinc ribbon domain-containing protein [Legionellaceae bacterium]
MPIYEYQCANCSHKFEIMQKISDAPVKQCPLCFEDRAIRMVSAAAFQLKGSGWYETDFKNKKPAAAAEGSAATEKTAAQPAVTSDTKESKD